MTMDINTDYSVISPYPIMIMLSFAAGLTVSYLLDRRGGVPETVCRYLMLLSPLMIRLLAEETYYSAWQYIPVLTLSMAAAAFSNFMGSVYVVTKQSKASFWTSLVGACRSPSLSAMAESCQASINTVARMVRMVGIL